jgi:hypothetical protein
MKESIIYCTIVPNVIGFKSVELIQLNYENFNDQGLLIVNQLLYLMRLNGTIF